jgi:hypothetical protein
MKAAIGDIAARVVSMDNEAVRKEAELRVVAVPQEKAVGMPVAAVAARVVN